MTGKRVEKPYIKLKDVEKLLDKQTTVILSAVDVKIKSLEKRMEQMELRLNQKFDRLVTTLDKFLKRLTDIEDELEIVKLDINRLKKVIKEKLGVDLS